MGLYLGPLTWAYAILLGGVLLLTPEGIEPIVYKVAGGISIVLGVMGFIGGRQNIKSR